MLARLAENLFWGGRYLERAEMTTRWVDVTHHLLLEAAPEEIERTWGTVLDELHLTHAYAEAHGDGPIATEEVLRFLITDPGNSSSVISSFGFARENARSVRELISAEVWEAVNELFLRLGGRDLGAEIGDRPYEVFSTVKRGCQMIIGVLSETMPRDDAYRFVTLGRMLERAEMTARLVDVRHTQLLEDPSLKQRTALLRSVGALESFRRRHGFSSDPYDVFALLLLEADHPRSVLFALDRAEEQLEKIGSGRGRAARALGRARAGLRYRDMDELVEAGLHDFLDSLQGRVRETSTAVTEEFFRHAPAGAMHAVASA